MNAVAANNQTLSRNAFDQQLAQDIAQFYDDPFGYVMYAFPWGQKGTWAEHHAGPDEWQRDQLMRIAAQVIADPLYTIQEGVTSGHGVGKSAQVAWVVLWAMSTRPHLAGWVTANTQTQLKGKTWRELAVWHKRAINGHWFTWTATRFYENNNPETWGIDAIPWTEHNSEAFAGLHAEHVLMIMDEASGIADIIWEVSEGAMTTPRAMWFCYGNPTRNTGRFYECFHKNAHRWSTARVDSRNAKMTNKKKIAEWLADHGEDSDFFRVRVRGEFPHTSSRQLIGTLAVHNARKLQLSEIDYVYTVCHIGVDVARFGDDESVISARQGRKHREMRTFRGLNNIQLAAEAAATYTRFQMQGVSMGAIFVDGIGVGAGVVDYLMALGYPVIDVNVGMAAEDKDQFYNKRVEAWWRLKEWIERGADIIDDPTLADQLTNIQYEYEVKTSRLKLETKEQLKERGQDSPDRAESLMLTFAEIYTQVARRGVNNLSFEPSVV